MASPHANDFNFPYFPSPPHTFQPPPPHPFHPPPPAAKPPSPSKSPPPPTPSHHFPPPPHTFQPPPPHPFHPPPPAAKPPSPSKSPPPPTPSHHFPPPPPHVHPPPPHVLPPPPAPSPNNNPTVIVIVFISFGCLFFLAFLAVAIFCCIKRRKKKEVQETEVIHFDEHRKVNEVIVPGPHGPHAVILSVEDDVHIDEVIRKDEKFGEGLHAKSAEGHPAGTSSSGFDHHHLEHRA
ncbi:hypothetical protein FH972_018365 [Carpinus fangiana]|uniref:Uncharacterized protein n=1 Tax=Carpinus fangiana TaxID=176857 RepID=A0A5N6RQB7_9ROSI|nr:hypothetical protein FH972_018365 [Carpinus fangiana]